MSAILRSRIFPSWAKVLHVSRPTHRYRELGQGWQLLCKQGYAVQVSNNIDKKCLDVTWEDGVTTNYPHIYLRDHCRCPSCYDPQTKSRALFNCVYNSYIDCIAQDANVSENEKIIQVDWKDDNEHPVSRFPLDWLRAHRFSNDNELKTMNQVYIQDRHTWGKEMKDNIPIFDYQELHENDQTLYRWLKHLTTIGLTIVRNTPQEVGQVTKLIARVGYNRTTNYGPTFQVKSKTDASNLAYTTGGLGMHTDLTYFNYIPGIQFLHCIKRAGEGGENQLVDGFKVAEELRDNEPEAFKMLSKYPIQYFDIGKDFVDFHQLAQHTIIQLHSNGSIARICYSDHARSPNLAVPQDKVMPFYDAMGTFLKYVYDPKYMVNVTLDSGDIAVFDNYRVMHGRSPFSLAPNSLRHLEGGYVDWDEAASRLRVLEEKYNMDHFTGIA
ncbi:Gamma-butyrobetaine dioxygenase [Trichoplax sp. H2]|nr:Gamma-butyrobetaine dioxygenase [Trichoplax sp. H2]|eukprot:RDD45920.1 Gamma-butyrobetaine dioxygenase [Trichoplax sp. H2]